MGCSETLRIWRGIKIGYGGLKWSHKTIYRSGVAHRVLSRSELHTISFTSCRVREGYRLVVVIPGSCTIPYNTILKEVLCLKYCTIP